MYRYSQMLKDLISVTNIKQMALANYLGYDISYINKWCNGIKLPSQKSIDSINDQISQLLAKDILEEDKGLDFLVKFNITIPDDTALLQDYDFLYNNIYSRLNNSYKNLSNDQPKQIHKDCEFIVGNSNIKFFLHNLIQKDRIKNKSQKTNILISMSIMSREASYIISLFNRCPNSNIKIGIDPSEVTGASSKNIDYIYKILSDNSYTNIQLYKNELFKNYNYIVVKHCYAINYALDTDENLEVISYTNDKEDVNKIYDILNSKFVPENSLLKSVKSLDMKNSNYRTDFYSADNFNIFSCYGFEFLLPPKLIDSIADKAYLETGQISDMLSIKKLQIEWDEIFQHRNINFFILKSALYKYIQEGNLIYIDTKYKLSIDERLEHFKKSLELMKNNSNIKIYIIEDEKLRDKIKYFNLGIYLNNNKFFLKNYTRFMEGNDYFISTVIDPFIVEKMNLYIEDIKNSDYCHLYDLSMLEKKYENYGNMFLRMMQIIDSSDNDDGDA